MAEPLPASGNGATAGGLRAVPMPRGTSNVRLLSCEEILRRPEPPWCVEGLFAAGSLNVLFGGPAHGKSFIALSIAAHIACGADWFGHRVLAGPVVYVAAEGAGGMKRRVLALLRDRPDDEHASILRDLVFTDTAVQVATDGLDRLIESIAARGGQPSLIVIDTLAQCFSGLDENDAGDMGAFLDGCLRLRERTGACILVVHHTAKERAQERGSSALRGAADGMFLVQRHEQRITITCDKQRDAACAPPIELSLETIVLASDGDSSPITSCRLAARAVKESNESSLRPSARRFLAVLREAKTAEGLTPTEISARGGGGKSTVYADASHLVKCGYAKTVRNTRPKRYVPTVGLPLADSLSSSSFSARFSTAAGGDSLSHLPLGGETRRIARAARASPLRVSS